MEEKKQTDGAAKGPGGAWALLEALRPRHWVKNAFVVAPILFSGKFVDLAAWGPCLAALAAFCMASSGVYLLNDVCDRQADRKHPVKKNRPIASGRLSVGVAVTASVVLMVAAVGLAAATDLLTFDASQPLGGWGLVVWTACYLVLNLLYSFWLKQHAIVDVLVVAMGFVLRGMAGAAAIQTPISPWLVVCTLTLCLFIALAKRRGELAEMPNGEAASARRAAVGYRRDTLEHMLAVSAGLAIVTYSLYCLAPRTIRVIGSGHMVWTIPLVIYGTFRYYRSTVQSGRGDAMAVLLGDRVMWLVVSAYVVLAALIIRYGRLPAVRNILDVGAY